jgi:acetyl-CoA acetyltransferase/uncharacterized OB-fold protein
MADAENRRPIPQPTPETAHFWKGAAEGRLVLQRCVDCDGGAYFPPRPFCPRCSSRNVEAFDASGRGRLWSHVINHRSRPGFEAPYAIAVVQLDEGPRMMTNLVDVDQTREALELDMDLEVVFEPVDDDVAIPLWRPVGADAPPRSVEPVQPVALTWNWTPSPHTTADRVAVVGAAETTDMGKIPGTSVLGLHADAALNALADAGLTAADIDGVATAGMMPTELVHHLGIVPTWVDGTSVGGCSFMIHVRHAAAAIAAGLATTVLITHGESGRSGVGVSPRSPAPAGTNGQFEAPYGPMGPPTLFTIPWLRYAKTYGATDEDLAMVAVVQREWAARNPRATFREPITVDDVLGSRMIAEPFHLLQCCLVTDGGGAIILTSNDRAAEFERPVYVLGTGESVETPIISQMEDFTSSRAFRISGPTAFARAGIEHADVDHLMIYDAFAHLPIYGLEDLGFVGRGEAPAFISERNTAPDGGSLPLNTNGGGLSYMHSGMYGMYALQESIRQVRGVAPAQITDSDGDPSVDVSVAHGVGGMFGAAGTVVFSRLRP